MVELDLSVYLVTDHTHAQKHGRTVPEVVAAAVAGGVRCIQIREKHWDRGDHLSYLAEVVAAAGSVPVLINDRVDWFIAAQKAGIPVRGVHIGQSDGPAAQVRKAIGPQAILGLTAATPALIDQAANDAGQVRYVGAGPVNPTATKADAKTPLGVTGLGELAGQAALPVVAIGGITTADVPALRRSGVAGIAISGAICAAPDPEQATAEFVAAWQEANLT